MAQRRCGSTGCGGTVVGRGSIGDAGRGDALVAACCRSAGGRREGARQGAQWARGKATAAHGRAGGGRVGARQGGDALACRAGAQAWGG
jgi:hypothetical protein